MSQLANFLSSQPMLALFATIALGHILGLVGIRGLSLESSATPLVPALQWGDTRVTLPFTPRGGKLKGLFSTVQVTHHTELLISAALGDFPVNLFIQT